MKLIDRHTLQSQLAQGGLYLLEALPAKYYDAEHLPGARHMPHDQVDALAAGLIPAKQAKVVVYCASAACQNSHIAAQRLAQLGYTDVAVYAEGKKDWIEAGLPVEGLRQPA
ncbi:rhodanese-like domain-containing protein [Chitinimonas sp.]|uniref:rhodanese-like domain-containing protein n=1 Tax=Chitinimonas sp. TaxID=1934313 RepID=UPI0035B35B7F